MLKKVRQCAGTMNCRYKLVLKVALILTVIGLAGVWLLAESTMMTAGE